LQWILAAEPTNPSIFPFSYLNSDIRSGSEVWSGDDTPGNGILWLGTELSSDICFNAETMIAVAYTWPDYSILYDPLGVFGPNSNSFTHLLVVEGGLIVPEPPGAVGWYFYFYP
jgi:hypothetical protein